MIDPKEPKDNKKPKEDTTDTPPILKEEEDKRKE